MPILRPCFNWPLCDSKAYARHASDTTRLCRACWNVAPKRYGKVYLDSSETPVPLLAHTYDPVRKRKRKLINGVFMDKRLVSMGTEVYPLNSETPAKPNLDHESQIDAYWEKHPELTRVQVSRRMK